MTKTDIINEIKRTAAANGGVPLGWRKFATETGIRDPDWKGKFWARWSDAVREAGLTPNEMTKAYSEAELLDKYAKLSVQLGQLPTVADTRLAVSNGLDFPSWEVFTGRFGGKPQLVQNLRLYCLDHAEYSAVVRLCDEFVSRERDGVEVPGTSVNKIGFVYLMKSAKYYKIGKANVTGRRHRELAIQMPERLIFVHEIKTDDPFGIEAYWHNRFAEKRRNGEWFELNAVDVAAFKKRRFQ